MKYYVLIEHKNRIIKITEHWKDIHDVLMNKTNLDYSVKGCNTLKEVKQYCLDNKIPIEMNDIENFYMESDINDICIKIENI